MPSLPEAVRERLIVLADQGEAVWQQVALITLGLLAEPTAVKMKIYQEVGACLGMKSAGVRSWVSTYQRVGDDLLAEFPQFRYTHWRTLLGAAHRTNKSLGELAAQWAATADDYAGLPVPPDKLAAVLGTPKDERPPLVKALERASGALVSAMRAAPPDMQSELERTAEVGDALIEQAAAVLGVTDAPAQRATNGE
jgi:hypothetical protein